MLLWKGLAKVCSEFDLVRSISFSILTIERIEINDVIILEIKSRSNQDRMNNSRITTTF